MNLNEMTVEDMASDGCWTARMAHFYRGRGMESLFAGYSNTTADLADRIIAERERETSALRTNEARERAAQCDCSDFNYCDNCRSRDAGGAL